ncbi:unnamed protein product [Ixodes persulcatus]
MVGLKCGFDTDYFTALKKKLASKPEDEQKSSDLADRGLVFMFCPFGANYAQPIGVLHRKMQRKELCSASYFCRQ